MYTLYNFLTEMETWTKPFKNDEERARIKKLKINTKNSKPLKEYYDDWVNGKYDEDPQILTDSLLRLANV
jgi:translation initiation factor 2 beta subunit (eIF-2beta)/eIF-5